MATKKDLSIWFLILSLPTIAGCGIITPSIRSEAKLNRISVGQNREEVLRQIGKPDLVRELGKLPDGSGRQVDEYLLYPKNQPWVQFGWGIATETLTWWIPLKEQAVPYWIEYVNNVIVRWGRASNGE